MSLAVQILLKSKIKQKIFCSPYVIPELRAAFLLISRACNYLLYLTPFSFFSSSSSFSFFSYFFFLSPSSKITAVLKQETSILFTSRGTFKLTGRSVIRNFQTSELSPYFLPYFKEKKKVKKNYLCFVKLLDVDMA